MGDFVSIFMTIIMLVILITFTYFATKWLAKVVSQNGKFKSGLIEIIDRIPLSSTQSLAIIKVSKKTILIGIAAQNISLIKELELSQETIDKYSVNAESFNDILLKNLTLKVPSFLRKEDKNAQTNEQETD